MYEELKLQNVILQYDADSNFRNYCELMHCRSNTKKAYNMVYDIEKKCHIIKQYDAVSFATYFNVLQVNAWKQKTYAEKFRLQLDFSGKAVVEIFEIYRSSKNVNINILKKVMLDSSERTKISIDIPNTRRPLVSFNIMAMEPFFLYGGAYVADVEQEHIRDIYISLASTTFKKEEYVKKNIALLKKDVLSKDSDMKDHIFVNIVDNGRTLDAKSLECPGLKIHSNINSGGSGGFARGMMESLHMEKEPTHVLLMDDDVLIMSESLFRTYYLLRILKPEYQRHFISGAMFDYDIREMQYEDIGFVRRDNGEYGPLKERMDMCVLSNLVKNEEQSKRKRDYCYAGWWYCCIPVPCIKENGLPLPVFVRGDDVEFSLRNQAEFLTLNGISIWHVGFGGKFNAAMELYQVHRNSLVIQATSNICSDIDFVKRIKTLFWKELTRFAYNNCEQLLDSVDDFMKGPDFLIHLNGEESIKQHGAKNEKMLSFANFSRKLSLDTVDPYEYKALNIVQKAIYVLTVNGHFLPGFLLKLKPEVISYDWRFVPGKNYRRKKLVAVNANDRTAVMRVINRRRCFSLMTRYFKVMRNYKKNAQKVNADYRNSFKNMVTEEFWKEYLGI